VAENQGAQKYLSMVYVQQQLKLLPMGKMEAKMVAGYVGPLRGRFVMRLLKGALLKRCFPV
jgi:hypothetical protein